MRYRQAQVHSLFPVCNPPETHSKSHTVRSDTVPVLTVPYCLHLSAILF